MSSSVEATRELCDDLDSLIEIAKQGRAPIRAVCLIERARGDLQAYLDEIHRLTTGAALEFSDLVRCMRLPERFTLIVPEDGLRLACCTVWHREYRMGVTFE
jgi:hypothetical protein